MRRPASLLTSFFFNDTATTEIYTLSLHDALPISRASPLRHHRRSTVISTMSLLCIGSFRVRTPSDPDRKSTRLNSSHLGISYAVFCLKKKKKNNIKEQIVYVDERNTSLTIAKMFN